METELAPQTRAELSKPSSDLCANQPALFLLCLPTFI